MPTHLLPIVYLVLLQSTVRVYLEALGNGKKAKNVVMEI